MKIHSREVYEEIMKQKVLVKGGASISSIARKFGIPRSTVSAWYHGRQPFFKLFRDKPVSERIIAKYLLAILPKDKRLLTTQSGDKRTIIRRDTVKKPVPESAKLLTPEKSYILGVICGDGYVNYKGNYISLETITPEFIEKFQECIIEVYGINFSGNIAPTVNGKQRIVICGKNMTEDVRRYLPEKGAFKWKAPEEIMASNEECKICFLQGFFDSEGSVNPRFDLNMTSVNREGLLQIKQLLESIGIRTSEIKPTKKERVYMIYITGEENIVKFIFKVGTIIPSRLNKMKKLLTKYGLSRKPLVAQSELEYDNSGGTAEQSTSKEG